MMINNINSDVLFNSGGLDNNSLLNIIDYADTEVEEPVIFEHSNYMNNDNLIDTLKEKKNIFEVLGLD